MNCPHCKTDIDEHEATRCLDRWVAEIVMGYSFEEGRLMFDDGRGIHESYTPYYSTEIEFAWRLVESTEGWFDLERIRNYEATPEYEWWDVAYSNKAEASAETIELAICRAAIKAKGKEMATGEEAIEDIPIDNIEREWLQLIADVCVDYDGYRTVKGLKGLIDDIKKMATDALAGANPYVNIKPQEES